MITQRIRQILMPLLGESLTARIHGMWFAHKLKTSALSEPEMELLPRFVGKGDVTVDVGAANASWSYALYQTVGTEGAVFAFEADPYFALATQHAMRIMKMNEDSLFHFGLSDKEEQLPLRIRDDSNQRVSGLAYIDKNADRERKEVTLVALKTLDSLVPEHPRLLRTSLLKCDVEGYELFVLKGAQRVLSTARPVVILEIGNFERQGYSARDVHSFLTEKNYEAFALIRGGKLAVTDEALDHQMAVGVNRVFIPREKLDSVADILQSSVRQVDAQSPR